MSIENSTSANKRIAKNTAFLYIRMVFVLLVSLYTTRVVLNALGVVDFGIYNVVAGFVAMFAFLNVSMTSGIQRFYNYTMGKSGKMNLTNVFNTSLQIQIVISAIVLFLLETVGLWYLYNQMVLPSHRFSTAFWVYQFSVISLVIVILQVPYSAAVIAHERMDFYALVSIVDAIAKLAIALLLPHLDADKLMVYGIYSLGVAIINFLFYYLYSKKRFGEVKLVYSFDKELFVSIMSFSGWNVFGTFAFMLRAQGLTVLLNAFFGAAINAAQGIAAQVQSAIQGFSGNIVVAFRPQMVQSYAKGEKERVTSLFFSLSKISYIFLLMLSVPVACEISYILHLWLGGTVPEYTESFTVLVLANMVLSSLHTPIVTIIHASGEMKKFQIVTSFIVCLIIPISWFFLKMGFSPSSVYWVSLALLFVNQVACLFVLHGVFSFRYRDYLSNVIYPCLLITLIVPFPSSILKTLLEPSFFRLLLSCICSVVFTCSVFFFVMNNHEKEVIYKIIDTLKLRLLKQKC